MTTGITDVEETLRKARAIISRGFKVIKLKGGLNVDEDIEKILKLRETIGNNIELRFDANQGYALYDLPKNP